MDRCSNPYHRVILKSARTACRHSPLLPHHARTSKRYPRITLIQPAISRRYSSLCSSMLIDLLLCVLELCASNRVNDVFCQYFMFLVWNIAICALCTLTPERSVNCEALLSATQFPKLLFVFSASDFIKSMGGH